MKSAVIVFPGSNCDRDMEVALTEASGKPAERVWHKESALPDGLDLVALPGGFSFGDYLRCGAIGARSPIMKSVVDFAERGGMVLGVCNGFQVLTETGLLPGALMMNAGLKFVCRDVHLKVETTDSPYTNAYGNGGVVRIPVAHHEGNFIVDDKTLAALKGDDRIAFTYCNADGSEGGNPNGAMADIAGILSENRRVLGMMPHPERLTDPALGGTDGAKLFESLMNAMATA
ncbi:phosphoribosylformylglycinamidine synthase subunit PurQ [Rhodobacteraceae bacterium NNCM2]|nr:phosphoribosylformylglycinamidine synthase subunit PurQ [Coraliihabitans acroporae]